MEETFITNPKLDKFFKDSYPHDTDRTDYVHFLREMNNRSSIKKLVKVHDKLLNKILTLQRFISYPSLWYKYDKLPNDTSSLLIELYNLLNEHIERLFIKNKDFSEKKILESLVNLRPAPNRDLILKNLLSLCPESARESINLDEIQKTICVKEDAPNHLSSYNINTNEYRDYAPCYIKAMKKLIKLGYIKDFRDSAFEKDAKINYIPDLKSALLSVAICLLVIVVFGCLMWLFEKLGIFGLLILGTLISFLYRGKM